MRGAVRIAGRCSMSCFAMASPDAVKQIDEFRLVCAWLILRRI